MNQSFAIQLQVVQRALGDVVMPALAGAEKHVIEQLQLSMAAIGFMQSRLKDARRFFRAELLAYLDMAEAVLQHADSAALGSSVAAGRAVLDLPEADDSKIQAATIALREEISSLVASAAAAPYEAALDALILEKSEAILMQGRLWCLPLGFELKPEDLPQPGWTA
jgi:hypothetical protein